MRLIIENRSYLLAIFVFTLMACGDGGCSSCAGCGVEPIPGGYPIADRIDNSAQVRLTSDGIAFIEDNIDDIVAGFLPGGLDFPIPRTSQNFVGTLTLCDAEDCVAHIEILDLELEPTDGNTLHATAQLLLDSRDTAGNRRGLPIDYWACNGNIDLDTRRGSRNFIAFEADIRFLEESEAARNGYTRVSVENADLVASQGIEDVDIEVRDCFLDGLLNLARGLIVDQLVGQLTGVIDDVISDQLCTTQGEYGCPTGTVAAGPDPGDVCEFSAGGRCVPTLLGTDGQGDLGEAFLGSISPGTHAPGQFLLAAGGEGEATNGGMSLFFYGGYRSTDLSFMTSPAHNSCVPVVEPPAMPTIPRAMTFRGNSVPGTGGSAHVGIGLAESFLNHAGYGMFDSGLLCIGAGTNLSQQLSSGLLSAFIMSLRGLAFPEESAPVAIALRPQLPPVFEIGAGTEEEALLTVTLPSVEVDFYIWSTERYIRFMTYAADLSIPVNLRVMDGAISPEIVSVTASNSVVTNAELLEEDPEFLASIVETVISEFAGMLTGGLSPIALPDLMGLELQVAEGGITGVEDGGEEFLGIFANLAVAAPAMPFTGAIDTEATLERFDLDPAFFARETYGEGDAPSVRVSAMAFGPSGVDYEYSYRVNGKPWSIWTAERNLVITDTAFTLQARHELEVRARVVGEPLSADVSPAQIEVLVDALPPFVTVEQSGRGVQIEATDVLTAREDLVLRYNIDGEGWTDWQALPAEAFVPLPYLDAQMEVEVRDEAGNVGAARSALIRGLPNADADGGCGCSSVETRTLPGTFALFFGVGLFLFRRRGQRRRGLSTKARARLSKAAKITSLLLVLAVVGCDCSSDPMPEACGDTCTAAVPPATNGGICCESQMMCISYNLVELCEPGFQCASGDAVTLDEACALGCSDCMRQPALDPGHLATHLDMSLAADGSAVLSGFSPGDPPSRRYGDLVIGTAPAGGDVTWEIVDGAPTTPITNDPDGYRGGVSDPGPDVGRWTSIVEGGGQYFVSYYDRTAGALKLAVGTPGAWTVSVVDDTGDSGRYSSIALTADGNPAIAYLQIVPSDDGSGAVMSHVRVAIADGPAPSGPPQWASTSIASAVMACRPGLCADGLTCTEAGACVSDTGDCGGTCASDQICASGSCETTLPDPYVEDMPPALGLYNSLVSTSTGLALVFYDRTSGNIWGAEQSGGAWAAPFLIDGYGTDTPGVGDSGLGASLFVDAAGVWHVSYADGAEEKLRYARIEGSMVFAEDVDDGSTDGSDANPDGRHIVGDDSSIVVTDGGEIRIVYQDATSRRAMLARRPAAGGDWAISIFDESDSTGFWLEQELLGGTSVVATFYRGADDAGVRLFNID